MNITGYYWSQVQLAVAAVFKYQISYKVPIDNQLRKAALNIYNVSVLNALV